MTQQQADSLKKLIPIPVIIDSNIRLDDMMRQAAAQSNCHVDCMTIQRLDTLLSEGMSVIMWGGYLGEELTPFILTSRYHEGNDVRYEYTDCVNHRKVYATMTLGALYGNAFDLLDRYDGEVPSGVIVDTLVAPHLALVIPGSNT